VRGGTSGRGGDHTASICKPLLIVKPLLSAPPESPTPAPTRTAARRVDESSPISLLV